MSLLGKFFSNTKKSSSTAFIEIAQDSVGGAYVYKGGEEETPLLVYTKRIPLETRTGEEPLASVVRALTTLGELLTREGAPALLAASGKGNVESVLVSLDAPWQATTVREENIDRDKPFTFTKSILDAALAKGAAVPAGHSAIDESVVGMRLDGYMTNRPLGKRASRATIVILSSSAAQAVVQAVSENLRAIFHDTKIKLITAASVRYQALREVFPHEEHYLFIDAASSSLVIALIRHKLLLLAEHIALPPQSSGTVEAWTAEVEKQLSAIGKRFPLPHTILLIAPEEEGAALKGILTSPEYAKLWLSPKPPNVLLIAPPHLAERLRLGNAVLPDLDLGLMAIFWKNTQA